MPLGDPEHFAPNLVSALYRTDGITFEFAREAMRCKNAVSGAFAVWKASGSNLEQSFSGFARCLSTGGTLKDALKEKIPEQQVALRETTHRSDSA